MNCHCSHKKNCHTGRIIETVKFNTACLHCTCVKFETDSPEEILRALVGDQNFEEFKKIVESRKKKK